MDIFSHALWGATIIRKRSMIWWAALAGALPDILGSGPGAIYLLIIHQRFWGVNIWQLLPDWATANYHLWHGLVGVLIILLILWLIGRYWLILIFPYLLHVTIDLFTHQGDILHRLFYPILPYSIERQVGINWWEVGWVWLVNFGLLLLINIIFLFRRKKANIDKFS
ncbi:MAG: hypothetical protein ABIJ81_00235 [Patescibacteria group bacterium]